MFTNIDEAFMWMATIVFFIGVVVLLAGIIILIVQSSGKNVKTVSESVSKLAQRGIAEDVATDVPALIIPAVFNAIGKWVEVFPITPDRVLKALGK